MAIEIIIGESLTHGEEMANLTRGIINPDHPELVPYKAQYGELAPDIQSRCSFEEISQRLLANESHNLERVQAMPGGGILFGIDYQGNPLFTGASAEPEHTLLDYNETCTQVYYQDGKSTGCEMFPYWGTDQPSEEILMFEALTGRPFIGNKDGEVRRSWLESGRDKESPRYAVSKPGEDHITIEIAHDDSALRHPNLGVRIMLRLFETQSQADSKLEDILRRRTRAVLKDGDTVAVANLEEEQKLIGDLGTPELSDILKANDTAKNRKRLLATVIANKTGRVRKAALPQAYSVSKMRPRDWTRLKNESAVDSAQLLLDIAYTVEFTENLPLPSRWPKRSDGTPRMSFEPRIELIEAANPKYSETQPHMEQVFTTADDLCDPKTGSETTRKLKARELVAQLIHSHTSAVSSTIIIQCLTGANLLTDELAIRIMMDNRIYLHIVLEALVDPKNSRLLPDLQLAPGKQSDLMNLLLIKSALTARNKATFMSIVKRCLNAFPDAEGNRRSSVQDIDMLPNATLLKAILDERFPAPNSTPEQLIEATRGSVRRKGWNPLSWFKKK